MRPVALNSQEAGAPAPVLPGCPWKLEHSVPHMAAQQEQGSLTGPWHPWAGEGTAQQKECWQRPQLRKGQRSSPPGTEMGNPATEMRDSSQSVAQLIRKQDTNKKIAVPGARPDLLDLFKHSQNLPEEVEQTAHAGSMQVTTPKQARSHSQSPVLGKTTFISQLSQLPTELKILKPKIRNELEEFSG